MRFDADFATATRLRVQSTGFGRIVSALEFFQYPLS
jgi:hypothetical protein